MKPALKRTLSFFFIVCIIFSTILPAMALQSSKSYKTGWKSGQTIDTSYTIRGGARTRYRVVSSKDVYVSEKPVTDKWVCDVTDWNDTTSCNNLSYNKSKTISASGSVDIIKKLGLKASISIGKTTSAGGSHKADPKKGAYARLAIKCDFVEIKYRHITYSPSTGKQTGSTLKTLLVPIPNTAVYYVRYQN